MHGLLNFAAKGRTVTIYTTIKKPLLKNCIKRNYNSEINF